MFAIQHSEVSSSPAEEAVWSDADPEWFAQATHTSAVDERDHVHQSWFRAQVAQLDLVDAIVEFDRVDAHSVDGARTVVAWLRSQLCISHGHAVRLLAQARGLRDTPQLRTALLFGAITFDHADHLIRVFTPARVTFTGRDVELLIDQVRALSVDHARILANNWALRVDAELASAKGDDDAPPTCDDTVSELHLGTLLDGDLAFQGTFNPHDAAVITAAIAAAHKLSLPASNDAGGVDNETLEDDVAHSGEGHERQATPVDSRTPAQQRADAFVAIAQFFLDHHATATGAATARPHLQVAIDLDALTSAHLTPTSTTSTGGLNLADVLHAACDCSVSRLLTSGPSIVLDIGRESRVVPPGLRKAVARRDRTCRHPACDMPAAFTDVHHIKHWINGGPTTRANCCLLCRHHHTAVHKRGWSITGNPNETLWFTSPDGTSYPSRAPNLTPQLRLPG